MKEFKNFKQMSRAVKHAGDKAVGNYQAKLEKNILEAKKEEKLKIRIAEEQLNIKYEKLKRNHPLQMKALKEFTKMWFQGKRGFLKHMVISYVGKDLIPYEGDVEGKRCSITGIKFTSPGDLLDKTAAPSLEAMAEQEKSGTMPVKKEFKGIKFAFTASGTDTVVCRDVQEALVIFCKEKGIQV